MPKCKHYDPEKMLIEAEAHSRQRHVYKLYQMVAGKTDPNILEFGVSGGISTCLLTAIVERYGGRLVSVDIRDFHDVVESDCWTFVQSSDLNVEKILTAAPWLRDGIDLLYVDSLHTYGHVSKQLMTWYPFVKEQGVIAFDDVDEVPYLPGEKATNYVAARTQRGVARAIREFFYGNQEHLELSFYFGGVGFGVMRKFSPLGTPPNPAFIMRSWSLPRIVTDLFTHLFWTALLPLRKLLIQRFPAFQGRLKYWIKTHAPAVLRSKNRY